MKQYHQHLREILSNGTRKEPAREGMPGSISLFGYQNRYNLSEGFPTLTTKKINFKHIVLELLWFLKGDTNIKYLIDNGCNIWNEDAYNYYLKVCKDNNIGVGVSYEDFPRLVGETPVNAKLDNLGYTFGDCGKQYGWLWRSWEKHTEYEDGTIKDIEAIDQIKDLIEGLKSNPMGRRHIITAWNPVTLDDMALNACHSFVQFNCRELSVNERINLLSLEQDRVLYCSQQEISTIQYLEESNIPKYYLDCQLYQRSADMFLGVPYNISSYALLTEIIARICNMIPGDFIHTFGDSHIYDNHLEQVKEILSRDEDKYALPKLRVGYNFEGFEVEHFEDIDPDDFQLDGYKSYPPIKAKLSTGLK